MLQEIQVRGGVKNDPICWGGGGGGFFSEKTHCKRIKAKVQFKHFVAIKTSALVCY